MGRCYGHRGPGEPCRLHEGVHKPLLKEHSEADGPGGEEGRQLIVTEGTYLEPGTWKKWQRRRLTISLRGTKELQYFKLIQTHTTILTYSKKQEKSNDINLLKE